MTPEIILLISLLLLTLVAWSLILFGIRRVAKSLSFREVFLSLFFISLMGIGGYSYLGRPGVVNLPSATQPASQDIPIEETVKIQDNTDFSESLVAARMQRLKGNVKVSAWMFKRLVYMQPDEADLWFEYGETMVLQRKNEEAMGAFDKALEIAPKHVGARYFKAIYEASKDNFQKSLQIVEGLRKEISKENPWNSYINAHILNMKKRLNIA